MYVFVCVLSHVSTYLRTLPEIVGVRVVTVYRELLWAVKNGDVDAAKKHLETWAPTCVRREASSSCSTHHVAETRTW